LALAISNNKFARYFVENKQVSISMSASIAIHLLALVAMTWLLSTNMKPAFVDQMLVITVDSSEARYAETVNPADQPNSYTDSEPVIEPTLPKDEPQQTLKPPAPEVLDVLPEPEPPIAENPLPQPPLEEVVLSEIPARNISEPQPLIHESPAFDSIEGATEVSSLTSLESTFEVVSASSTKLPKHQKEAVSISTPEKIMLEDKTLNWISNSVQAGQEIQQTSWQINDQTFDATFTVTPPENDMSLEIATVEINTTVDGEQRTTSMQLNRLAFSNFGQFINKSDRNTYIHNDEFDGRFHSNTRMTLSYSRKVKPKFLGKVTTSAKGVLLYNNNNTLSRSKKVRKEIFQGGFEDNIKKIPLPKTFIPFPEESPVEEEQIHRFSDDTAIVFHQDGSYSWRTAGGETERKKMGEKSLYIIGEKKTKLTISGEVHGKALVYTPERIIISGDLTYAGNTDPSNQSDYLGLVSDKYIDIAAPSVTGSGDLSIHAAIYAGKRFSIKRYTHRKESLLYIFGSLTVGSMSPTEPRFRTLIKFDERLENLRPPGFPMTERYELGNWDANWTTTEAPKTPIVQSAP